ncbi:MAG: GDP-L-fucose synthase [Smithella sp.]
MILNRRIRTFLAGHQGMVGSATMRLLQQQGFTNLLTVGSKELNLTDQMAVVRFFEREKPEIVILCAAKVGGIQANIDNPATFLLDNLQIQNNVMTASLKHGVNKFVFLGSSCIYPKECPQPMKEEYLLNGKPEPTNEGYAIAKIAGIKLLEGLKKQYGFSSISLMPCNLYGPNDSFDLKHSHVLSALVKRFVDASAENVPSITLWGTGIARREFMHVDDMARAILFMLENYDDYQFINIGTGLDISIKELAGMVAGLTGYSGKIFWDNSKPDGMLKKCMDVSRMEALGFKPEITLQAGIEQMIEIYKRLKEPA